MRYTKYKRKVNKNGETQEKYMAKLVLESPVTLEAMAKKIEKQTAATEADVLLVLKALEKNISESLTQGHSVKLGILGSFYPTINAKTVDKSDDVLLKTIKRVSCIFRPSKELRIELGNASLKAVDNEIRVPRERKINEGKDVKKRKKLYKR